MPVFEPIPDGLRLRVRVTPRGGADRVEGVDPAHDALRVRVRAVPEDGKANVAVRATVAAALGVARSDVTLVAGATARLKVLHVRGDPAALSARAATLYGGPRATRGAAATARDRSPRPTGLRPSRPLSGRDPPTRTAAP